MQDFNLSSVIIAIAFIVSVIVVVFWWTSNKSARKANDFFSDQKYFPENEENAEYAKQLYENETEINKSLPDLHLRVIYLMGRMNDIEKTNRNHQKDSIYETACKSIAYRISKQLQDKSEEILSYYKQEVYWTGKAKMPDRNKTPINTDKGFLASSLELAINEEEKNNLRDKFNQFWENQASWEEVVSVNDNDEVPDFLKMIESVNIGFM